MGVIDIVIVLAFIFGAYIGYQRGFFKEINDLFIVFIASFLSGKISDILFGMLYKFFPFLNFYGKSEGLKSINIILWKLIFYVIIIMLIMLLIRKLYVKFKIEDKITDTMVEANVITRILGIVISIPLMIVLLFNIMLVGLSPNFNLTSINNSKFACFILEKTPVLSKENKNLYENQKYIIKRINEDDNTINGYKKINNDIVNNIIKTNLVSEDKILFLKKKNKLVGKRKKENNQETKEDLDNNSSSNENSNSKEDNNESETNNSQISDDSEEESEVIEEEKISNDESVDTTEDIDKTNYCEDFPEEC